MIENPRVPGSIPGPGTIFSQANQWFIHHPKHQKTHFRLFPIMVSEYLRSFEPPTPCTPYMAINASKDLIYKAIAPFLLRAKRAVLGLYKSMSCVVVS